MTLDLAAEWWAMPGPRRYLSAIQTALTTAPGCAAITLPRPEPEGLMDALVGRLRCETLLRVVHADASGGLEGSTPAHWLAAFSGVTTANFGTVGAFLEHPALRETAFVVSRIAPRDLGFWGLFLRTLAAERAASGVEDAPVLVLSLPPDLPLPDRRALMRGAVDLPWVGRVRRADSEAYAEACCDHPADDIISRLALAVAVELGAWDPILIRALSTLPAEERIDPISALLREAGGLGLKRLPRWADGWVDRWDGDVVPHTIALLSEGQFATVQRRIWRAHVRELFPFVESVRLAFIRRFGPLIADDLKANPLVRGNVTTPKVIAAPEDLELTDLWHCIKGFLGIEDSKLIRACVRVRRSIAHLEPVPRDVILDLARLWENRSWLFPDAAEGWLAPDAGQTLTLMVGPPAAGKSTWVAKNWDPASVVSSDAVRREIYGRIENVGPQEEVFAIVYRRARDLITAGRSVVIDATHLKARDRAASRRIAAGRPVSYVVVDRDLTTKLAERSWRSEDLVREMHEVFAAELPAVLSGDGDREVQVTCVSGLTENRAVAAE